MSKSVSDEKSTSLSSGLFDQLVSILEQARGHIVQWVNTNTLQTYPDRIAAIRYPAFGTAKEEIESIESKIKPME